MLNNPYIKEALLYMPVKSINKTIKKKYKKIIIKADGRFHELEEEDEE